MERIVDYLRQPQGTNPVPLNLETRWSPFVPQSDPFGERMETNESQDSGIQGFIPVVDVANPQSYPFGERMKTNESQDSGIQGLIHDYLRQPQGTNPVPLNLETNWSPFVHQMGRIVD